MGFYIAGKSILLDLIPLYNDKMEITKNQQKLDSKTSSTHSGKNTIKQNQRIQVTATKIQAEPRIILIHANQAMHHEHMNNGKCTSSKIITKTHLITLITPQNIDGRRRSLTPV